MSGGMEMTVGEIMDKMLRNRDFYKTGGITVTGGEPLMQPDFLYELLSAAKKEGIHTCIDTSGICFTRTKEDYYKRLLSVCDLVMLDIKHIDENEHIKLTGHSNKNVLDFCEYLNEQKIPVWIRHVAVPEITYKDECLKALGKYIKKFDNIEKIEVLPYHSLGRVKYEKLGIKYPLENTLQLTKEEAHHAEEIIKNA